VGVDFVALLIQAIGGGQAATAPTPQDSQHGAHVMVGGIVIQMGTAFFFSFLFSACSRLIQRIPAKLAAVAVYALVSIEYVWRVFTERPIRAVQETYNAPTLEVDGTAAGSAAAYAAGEKSNASLPAPSNGRARLTHDVKMMVLGLAIATVLVIVRSIYRTIEVSQ